MIYTVTIVERGDDDMMPWVTAFSSEEKAETFIEKVKAKLRLYGLEDQVSVTCDSGNLDDEMYLDWIDARYEDLEKE